MYTQLTNSNFVTEDIPTDLKDAKGRLFGVAVTRFDQSFDVTAEQRGGYHIAPGRYFAATVQQTRDGNSYGASQSEVRAATKDELEKMVAKKVATCLKTIRKNAVPVTPDPGCEHCGAKGDHSCYGTRGEAGEAKRYGGRFDE